MKMPDLSQMEEITCSDCGKPLIVVKVKETTDKYEFLGCTCQKEYFELPDCIVAGFAPGPLFLYKPKQK